MRGGGEFGNQRVVREIPVPEPVGAVFREPFVGLQELSGVAVEPGVRGAGVLKAFHDREPVSVIVVEGRVNIGVMREFDARRGVFGQFAEGAGRAHR